MKKIAFDNEKYLKIQREAIQKRIELFGDKLYLEFGGKLFDDLHASRVLPGFEPQSKLKMLLGMKDKAEIILVVNSEDINSNKIREDIGITYQAEAERLIDGLKDIGLFVSSVVLSFYRHSPLIDCFKSKLEKNNIKVYKSYKINGYPNNIPLIVSEEGLGMNEYIETTRPLVVVTAPGPASGKMGTCFSQLYHDAKHGIRAGYAKFETFPIWNIGLKHPINMAYEAATVELNDVNMIDPYHFEKYGTIAVNYNRDVEAFPLLKAIFEKIYGNCPYNSPTDMGVNMAGFAIKNDEVACQASKDEIIRRYYKVLKNNYLGKYKDETIERMQNLLQQVELDPLERKAVKPCLKKAEATKVGCLAIELNNGRVLTGKTSSQFTATAAALLNCLKKLAKIDDSLPVISKNVIEPIQQLKSNNLRKFNSRLDANEVLIALSIQAHTNALSELIIKQIPKLKGCQAHASEIISETDSYILRKLGIDLTEEPKTHASRLLISK